MSLERAGVSSGGETGLAAIFGSLFIAIKGTFTGSPEPGLLSELDAAGSEGKLSGSDGAVTKLVDSGAVLGEVLLPFEVPTFAVPTFEALLATIEGGAVLDEVELGTIVALLLLEATSSLRLDREF